MEHSSRAHVQLLGVNTSSEYCSLQVVHKARRQPLAPSESQALGKEWRIAFVLLAQLLFYLHSIFRSSEMTGIYNLMCSSPHAGMKVNHTGTPSTAAGPAGGNTIFNYDSIPQIALIRYSFYILLAVNAQATALS